MLKRVVEKMDCRMIRWIGTGRDAKAYLVQKDSGYYVLKFFSGERAYQKYEAEQQGYRRGQNIPQLHPFLVTQHESYFEGDSGGILMDYGGWSLHTFMRSSLGKEFFHQIVEQLHYLHKIMWSCRLYHLDLHEENIVVKVGLGDTVQIKIIDLDALVQVRPSISPLLMNTAETIAQYVARWLS